MNKLTKNQKIGIGFTVLIVVTIIIVCIFIFKPKKLIVNSIQTCSNNLQCKSNFCEPTARICVGINDGGTIAKPHEQTITSNTQWTPLVESGQVVSSRGSYASGTFINIFTYTVTKPCDLIIYQSLHPNHYISDILDGDGKVITDYNTQPVFDKCNLHFDRGYISNQFMELLKNSSKTINTKFQALIPSGYFPLVFDSTVKVNGGPFTFRVIDQPLINSTDNQIVRFEVEATTSFKPTFLFFIKNKEDGPNIIKYSFNEYVYNK